MEIENNLTVWMEQLTVRSTTIRSYSERRICYANTIFNSYKWYHRL